MTLFDIFNTADRKTNWKHSDALAARKACKELTRWNQPGVRAMTWEAKDTIGQALADALNGVYGKTNQALEECPEAKELTEEGATSLGQLIPTEKAKAIREYFLSKPCYNSHVYGEVYGDKVGRDPKNEARQFRFGSYPQNVALLAPHLIDYLVSDKVLNVAELYLGARPMLFSVNTFWSFPQPGVASYGQDYHRDISHPRLCVLFIYLTDADIKTGAHQYIRKTHKPSTAEVYLKAKHSDRKAKDFFDLPMDGLGFTDLYESYFKDQVVTLAGKAGTAFVEDGYGLHRGLPPVDKPRLLCWARYSLFTEPPDLPKLNKQLLGNHYPNSKRAQYALRGVLE